MKLSYNWLNDFIDLSDLEITEVANKLTMGAFEVEEIIKTGDPLEGKVVLGQILEIDKHPDADKLQVTKTQIADGDIQQIVCGANNIKVGDRVPVATVGSQVVNRTDGSKLKIKKSKIRGVESCGMLCSADELGYSEEAAAKIKEQHGDGIYLLNDVEGEIGTDIRQVLGFNEDWVLDVGARSNRGDALSILGQARELCALLNKKIKNNKQEALAKQELSAIPNIKIDTKIKSHKPEITDSADCQVFYTLAVENIKVQESPTWIKQRLEAMGQKSINNIVDISNYVLLELGQPMHFYDRDTLSGDSLIIRRAQDGEEFKTLDDQECKLTNTNLMVADSAQSQCIAGVMGGFDSQVTDSTTSIIIESAAFNAAAVRKSSRAVGIESESKRRFERGVDPQGSKLAIIRAIELLKETNPDIKVGEILMAGSAEVQEQIVELKLSDITRYLGIEIDSKTIISLLASLEIKLIEDGESLKFSIPSFRQNDITRAEDLVEEVGRLYGFDKIPAEPPSTSCSTQALTTLEAAKNQAKSICSSYGFSQAVLSSLVGETLNQAGLGTDEETTIAMLNPLSKEHSVLRQAMIPGLIQAASRNLAQDRGLQIKLFELGKVYFKNSQNETEEQNKIAAIMIANNEAWDATKPGQALGFYYLKSLVQELYPNAEFANQNANSYSHPGIHAEVTLKIKGKASKIGYLAKLHPSISKEWDLADETYVFELDLPTEAKVKKFKSIANIPAIERDITVDADTSADVESQQIIDLITANSSKTLTKVQLLTSYKAAKDSPTESLSYRLRWQPEDTNVSREETDKEISELKNLLESKLAVKFRV